MPHCENTNCAKPLTAEQTRSDASGRVLCVECAKVTPLHLPAAKVGSSSEVLGRDFDYSIGYTRKQGIQAHVRLGGAKISFEVSAEELTRTFGPENS